MANSDRTALPRRRRNRMWLLAVCAGLLVSQPTVATSQTAGGPVSVAQLDASVREPVCQLVRSLQATFADIPGVAAIFTSLLQSFGCSSGPTPGTTSTTAGVPTTTTTLVPTTSSTGGTGTTSAPTSSTTLPPCIPNNPVPTTVPCVPTTSTTTPTGPTTTTAPQG